MAHRVRVMPFKTLRLHLATCPPYNADFDGDEMNLHIPQTEEAIVEAYNLMLVPKHIRSPRFSGPIIGARQDFITGLYLLTKREEKIPRKDFVQLIRATNLDIEIPEKKFLSGREVFSLFLPRDFSIQYKSKSGEIVVIENGEIKSGYIDKAGVGAESGKILDKMQLYYGPEVMKKFLFDICKLSILYLMKNGFSISIADQDLPEEARMKKEKIIESAKEDVNKLIKDFESGKLKLLIGRTPRETLEARIKRRLSKVLSEIESLLDATMKENETLVMVRSGARGDKVNIIQTAACVGQEAIMGERIEKGYFGRTFPHFKIGDMSVEGKGFVSRGFKEGLNPFEFFFDSMNSRESLMDKSLKTRHSGYMERRLVGALEDLKVEYDGTVRDSSGRIIQFLAGEDGLDPSKIERVGINVDEIARRLFG
jgi:DNA-directed RNA polymerase subunit A'